MKIKCIYIEKINDNSSSAIKLHDASKSIPEGWQAYDMYKVAKRREDLIDTLQKIADREIERGSETSSIIESINKYKDIKDTMMNNLKGYFHEIINLEYTQEEIDEFNEGK